MHVRIELKGRSPLVCHNIQLADPDNPVVKEIKALTSKREKTEDDRRAIERLEWFGGIYLAPGIDGPVMPTANLRRCLNEGAKITKHGKSLVRALSFADLAVPILYDGPRDLETMYADAAFRYRAPVKVGTAKTYRMRPIFREWQIVANAYLQEDMLDPAILQRVIDQTGIAEGLGDNRINGYGRFDGNVIAI